MFRDGVHGLLDSLPATEVVAEAGSGEEAVAMAAALAPDVVLMDVKMPGVNGIEATRAIVAANPAIAVLMVTMFEDDDTVFAAMRAGARGYILKEASQDELLRAISTVSAGGAVFGPGIAQRLVLSLKTVQNHVSNICGKLQLADRAQAAIRARDAGLVS